MNKPEPMRILAIETSCDETAAAVVENGRKVLSNVIFSDFASYALRRSCAGNRFQKTY